MNCRFCFSGDALLFTGAIIAAVKEAARRGDLRGERGRGVAQEAGAGRGGAADLHFLPPVFFFFFFWLAGCFLEIKQKNNDEENPQRQHLESVCLSSLSTKKGAQLHLVGSRPSVISPGIFIIISSRFAVLWNG